MTFGEREELEEEEEQNMNTRDTQENWPSTADFAKDKAFSACLLAFFFQFAFRAFFFALDVRFLGTAIIKIHNVCIFLNIIK